MSFEGLSMRHSMQLFIGLIIAGLSFLGIHQPVTSTGETTTQFNGKIAFVELTKNGSQLNTQIYIMNADGSQFHQLTDGDRHPWSPALSPDGKQIAFAAKVDGRYQIFMMDSNGANEKQLTHFVMGQTGASSLDWSHDGKQIIFTHKVNDDRNLLSYELFVMDATGTNEHKIMDQAMESLVSPHWSPDGQQIVFGARGTSSDDPTKPIHKASNAQIYIINTDGSDLHGLSLSDNDALFPAWSFDGKSIIFQSGGQSDSDIGLFRINADGTNLVKLSNSFYTMPTTSPDGKYLAVIFPELKNGITVSNIFVTDRDGANPIKITDTDKQYLMPSWLDFVH
ncbi:MAG: hypothetical protein GC179_30050 [Anaerolineaceae bacterium]|nr:hypothetical protein [Anaerolineaceae bacterium]